MQFCNVQVILFCALFKGVSKMREANIRFVKSVCLSVCPHGTTPLPLEGFSLNFIFEYFSKMCRGKNFSLISDENNWYIT